MKAHFKDLEYEVKPSSDTRKRVCLALDLKDQTDLIGEYKRYHSRNGIWKEINEGIKHAGIQVMDIYNIDNRLFMICELKADSDFDQIWSAVGTYSRQTDWAELMATFQQALPGHKLEWIKMERVFTLYDFKE